MKLHLWSKFKGGWFIGNFSPTIIPSNEVEVAVKRYKSGDYDKSHYHKEADEVTMIITGVVRMNNKEFYANDIIWIEKNEHTDFLAVTDAITCVIKLPCVKGDKYVVDSPQG